MTIYKIKMLYSDGTSEIADDEFDTEEDAIDCANYLCGCYHQGAKILNMSNPGDYPIDEDDDIDYEIIEVKK